MSEAEVPDARSVVALLTNEDSRRVFALVALGASGELRDLTSKEGRALVRLQEAHLITAVDRSFEVNAAGLQRCLSQFSGQRHTGIDRFVRDGRIVNYPASDRDRRELLEWVGRQILTRDESLAESDLNERLKPFMEEHVLLRRYLVDYGVVVRDPDGTNYALASTRG